MSRTGKSRSRIALSLTGTAVGVVLLALSIVRVGTALDDPWNDIRIAPTAALLLGMPMYTPLDETGPLLDAMYGPVSHAFWIGPALLRDPTAVIAAGLLLAAAAFFLPAVWMLGRAAGPNRRETAVWASLCLWVTALSTPVFAGAWGIHADAPAIGFGVLACLALTFNSPPSGRQLMGGAIATVLAVGSKQVMVPLVAAAAIWLALVHGRRVALRYTGWVAAAATLLLGGIAAGGQLPAMLFAAILGPARHPWSGPAGGSLALAGLEFVTRAHWVLGLLAAASYFATRTSGARPVSGSSHHWTLPAMVGAAMLPMGVLGRVKYGGAPNSFAFAMYFLLVAALQALIQADRSRASRDRHGPPLVVLLLVAVLLTARLAPRLIEADLLSPSSGSEEQGMRLAARYPEQVYFPFHPLIAMRSDHRADHSEVGVYYRDLGRRPVSDEYFRAFLPPRLRLLATTRRQSSYVWDRLPTFRLQSHDPEAPDWYLFRDDIFAGLQMARPCSQPSPDVGERLLPTCLPPEIPARFRVDVSAELTAAGRGYALAASFSPLRADDDSPGTARLLIFDTSGRHLVSIATALPPVAPGRAEWRLLDQVAANAAYAVPIQASAAADLVMLRRALESGRPGWSPRSTRR